MFHSSHSSLMDGFWEIKNNSYFRPFWRMIFTSYLFQNFSLIFFSWKWPTHLLFWFSYPTWSSPLASSHLPYRSSYAGGIWNWNLSEMKSTGHGSDQEMERRKKQSQCENESVLPIWSFNVDKEQIWKYKVFTNVTWFNYTYNLMKIR